MCAGDPTAEPLCPCKDGTLAPSWPWREIFLLPSALLIAMAHGIVREWSSGILESACHQQQAASFNILPTSTEKMPCVCQRGQKTVLLSNFFTVFRCLHTLMNFPPSLQTNKTADEAGVFILPSELALDTGKVIIFLRQLLVKQENSHSPISYFIRLLLRNMVRTGSWHKGSCISCALAVACPTLQHCFFCPNTLLADVELPSSGRKDKQEPALHGMAGGQGESQGPT